jgi:hypothetical protein
LEAPAAFAAPPIATDTDRRPIGLLLVAAPVSLVIGLVIWPIISALALTVWLPDADGSYGLSFRTYVFFFTDDYSVNNLKVTL